MRGKMVEAVVIGLALWVAGGMSLLLLGQAAVFPPVAVAATFLLMPATMYLLARFHLRDVPRQEQAHAGIRLGMIVTAVQCPLDALALGSIFWLGYPPLSMAAREAVVVSLEVGYFWLLVVPWWYGTRTCGQA